MSALIVVPTYNEIENIQALIEAALANSPASTELLVVDDGSPDGTGACVQRLARSNPRIHALHREKKMGLVRPMLLASIGVWRRALILLIEMDADFSHNPKYLPRMLSSLETNDVAIGSRYVEGGGTVNWGFGRKLLSRAGSIYARTILALRFGTSRADSMAGVVLLLRRWICHR